MPSIYDEEVIAELRAQQRAADAAAKQHAEQAAGNIRDAAGQRSRARQFEALLAYMEGRDADSAAIARKAELVDKQRAALVAALSLLDAEITPVWSWQVSGRNAELDINLDSFGDAEFVALAAFARHLGVEIVEERSGERIVHQVKAEHLGAPVEITVLRSVPSPEQAPAEGEASE